MRENWSMEARFGLFRAPGGWCAAAWTPQGLSALILPQENQTKSLRKLHENLPPVPIEFWRRSQYRVSSKIQSKIRKAINGKPFRFSTFDLSFLTTFQQRVLAATCTIPCGQVRTYGWVARKAGSPRGFRAVGQALNRNPVPLLIPCHRVIGSGNRLGGYGGGIDWKIRFLKREGLQVTNDSDGSYKVS